jgi:hypothetical protein
LYAETYTLERKLTRGQRTRVEEASSSELTQRYVGRDAAGHRGSAGNVEVSEVLRTYVEEVLVVQPERLARHYELSTRAKFRQGEDATPERTSLHDRSVLVEGLSLKPADEAFQISKPDREALRFDRLAVALLPPQRVVERGEEWTLSSEVIGRALWGSWVPAGNVEGSGAKVQLKTVRERKGRLVATLKVKGLRVHLARSEQLPGVDMNLRGELSWAVEEGVLLAGELEGTLSFSMVHKKDGGKADFEARGPVAWRCSATILESREEPGEGERTSGEPPPAGTTRLVCEQNPGHKLNMSDLRCCTRCGAELTREKGCPEHAWVFQYCPHDGAPFRPE